MRLSKTSRRPALFVVSKEELQKEDLIFFKDGQRPGIHANAAKQLVKSDGSKMKLQMTSFTIGYNAESYLARRERIKSFINTTETLVCWSQNSLSIKKSDRVHYEGSNYVLAFGPVVLPAVQETWLEPTDENLGLKQLIYTFISSQFFFTMVLVIIEICSATSVQHPRKEKIWGPTFMVLVGGPNPHPEVVRPTFEESKDPVCWYPQSREFYETILIDFQLKGLVDFCTVDLELPMTCILHSIPFVGLVPTPYAVQKCRNKMIQKVWGAFLDPNSPLYESRLSEIVAVEEIADDEAGEGEPNQGSKGASKGKGGSKGRGGSKGKGGNQKGKGKNGRGKGGKGGKGGQEDPMGAGVANFLAKLAAAEDGEGPKTE